MLLGQTSVYGITRQSTLLPSLVSLINYMLAIKPDISLIAEIQLCICHVISVTMIDLFHYMELYSPYFW